MASGSTKIPNESNYISTFERTLGYFRKPIVALTAVASLLGPLQARTSYADAELKPGRDQCLAHYVKSQTDILAGIEGTVKFYAMDPSQHVDLAEGVELIVQAIASPHHIKRIEQHKGYADLILVVQDQGAGQRVGIDQEGESRSESTYTVHLPKHLGERLEECMRRMNAISDGGDYCSACQLLTGLSEPESQFSSRSDQSRKQQSGSSNGSSNESPDKNHSDQYEQAADAEIKKSSFPVGPVVVGLAALGFALGAARHAVGVGGIISGGGGSGGGGSGGSGFTHGGTGVIPPLPGGAHR